VSYRTARVVRDATILARRIEREGDHVRKLYARKDASSSDIVRTRLDVKIGDALAYRAILLAQLKAIRRAAEDVAGISDSEAARMMRDAVG
jgi:hypothetical protein